MDVDAMDQSWGSISLYGSLLVSLHDLTDYLPRNQGSIYISHGSSMCHGSCGFLGSINHGVLSATSEIWM